MFSNAGIGEYFLKENGIDILVANELLLERSKVYSHLHPNATMVQGDITDQAVFDRYIEKCRKVRPQLFIATPPCQSFSTANTKRQGAADPRDFLINKALEAVQLLIPDYVLIENVAPFLKATIDGAKTMPQHIADSQPEYSFSFTKLDAADYGTAQHRKRAIILGWRKGLTPWGLPQVQPKICLDAAIGHLASLESGQTDTSTPWHFAAEHNRRQVLWLKNTPTGLSAFKNTVHYPQKDGRKIKAFDNSYKRMEWHKPAYTITTNSGSISTQNSVHPGRKLSDGTYSDARTLTIAEILLCNGLPLTFSVPHGTGNKTVRHILGECISPKFLLALCRECPLAFQQLRAAA